MQEINLLQNRVKDATHLWQKQTKLTVTILSVVLILLVGITASLFLLIRSVNNKSSDLVAQNQGLQDKFNSKQSDLASAKVFQAQLANFHLLLKNHSYISPVLDELAKMTYSKAQYITMDVTDAGKIHLEGHVATYGDLGKLLLGLSTSKKFSNVKLLSAVPSTGKTNSYIFAIDLNAMPDLFTKK